MGEQRARADRLRELHDAAQPLVLPNVWDAASAKVVQEAGFPVVATSSFGIAGVFGFADGSIPPHLMLEMVGRIAAVVTVPVTADLEGGYGTSPEQVAATVAAALRLGIVGMNLEDGTRRPEQPLADIAHQVAMIHAIRGLAEAAGVPLVLNARTDVFFVQQGDEDARFAEALRRGRAYRDAGADCIFPIGLRDADTIGRFVRELGSPVNVMLTGSSPTIDELRQLGVARISFGAGLFRGQLASTRRMMDDLRRSGDTPQWRAAHLGGPLVP